MLQKTSIITETYDISARYNVDISFMPITNGSGERFFEAYLCNDIYGIKMLMFSGWATKKEFLKMVENNLPEYLEEYQREIEDREDDTI